MDNASSEGPMEKEKSREVLPVVTRLDFGTCRVWRCTSFEPSAAGASSGKRSWIEAPGDIEGGEEKRVGAGATPRESGGDRDAWPCVRAVSGTVEAVTMWEESYSGLAEGKSVFSLPSSGVCPPRSEWTEVPLGCCSSETFSTLESLVSPSDDTGLLEMFSAYFPAVALALATE